MELEIVMTGLVKRKSSLLDLRDSIVRTSGKPEVRCHPRLGCGTKDVDARDEPAHDGYKRAEPAIVSPRCCGKHRGAPLATLPAAPSKVPTKLMEALRAPPMLP